MPTSRTNPPSGIALMPYSVSPLVRDQTVGPKPTKYWLTRTPNFLAGIMCPSSCSPTETMMPSSRTSQPTTCGTMLTDRDYGTC